MYCYWHGYALFQLGTNATPVSFDQACVNSFVHYVFYITLINSFPCARDMEMTIQENERMFDKYSFYIKCTTKFNNYNSRMHLESCFNIVNIAPALFRHYDIIFQEVNHSIL